MNKDSIELQICFQCRYLVVNGKAGEQVRDVGGII